MDRGPPPCRSPYSLLHLLRLSDSKGKRGWGTPIRLMQGSTEGSYTQGRAGLHSHGLTELCGASYYLCYLYPGPASEDSKCYTNVLKIIILLSLIHLHPWFVACGRSILGCLLFVLPFVCFRKTDVESAYEGQVSGTRPLDQLL